MPHLVRSLPLSSRLCATVAVFAFLPPIYSGIVSRYGLSDDTATDEPEWLKSITLTKYRSMSFSVVMDGGAHQ
jgi:hypothetical protein